MNKTDIENFINERPKWYQKIKLPYELETPGKDRDAMLEEIFPADLKGASVLDVGCAEGFFSVEAKRRNAGKVVGVDINDERLNTAKKIADILKYDIDYINANITEIEELGKFDYVLCLNLLHHVKDPIHVIRSLNKVTDTKLILEVADLRIKFYDLTKELWIPLFRILPSFLKPSVFMIDSRGKTLLTKNWIKSYFDNVFCNIEKLEFKNSDRNNRYVVICYKRQLDYLRIISGPSGVGKSHFINNSPSDRFTKNNVIDFNIDESWTVMKAQTLERSSKENIRNLLLHYDIIRPVKRGYSSFDFEPALSIINTAKNKKSYVLFCKPDVLINRVKKVLGKSPKSRHIYRANFLINQYCNPEKIGRIYRNWINFCKTNNCEVEYINVTDEKPQIVTEQIAFSLLY